ncbi:MAG: rRNA (pseudouridine1915-N3)-methyltransferase [Candidatus Cloacimonadota bacterium]|nr:rRNA (pseudouridine1915-N3)-methyltransferase [Candidatus Cloacimonadota bacterium]
MQIRIIQVGKDKDTWLSEAIQEYRKRLRPFCRLDILQIPDVSIKQTGNRNLIIMKESLAIMNKIETDDFCVLLDEKGEQKTSLEFSSFLTKLSDRKRIVFVIAGVYGSSTELKDKANCCLSLSKMTFTHRMSRLILIEQIYRAMMIAHGRSYHIE